MVGKKKKIKNNIIVRLEVSCIYKFKKYLLLLLLLISFKTAIILTIMINNNFLIIFNSF